MYPITTFTGRQWRWRATTASIIGLLASSAGVAQTTVGVGTTLLVTSDTIFSVTEPIRGRLEMDGGQLRVSNAATGQALTVIMDAALLKRGTINNPYNQTGVSKLVFNFNTELAGGPVGSDPADVMYIRASSFDSRGFQVFNNGTFVQDGLGRLVTAGPVQFNNSGIFDIRNDLGFQAGDFTSSGFKPFFNTGVFKKTGGEATSFVNAIFHQDGGVVAAQTGSLALASGGYHKDASFLANPLGSNPTGQILLGGAHIFTGTVITYAGGLIGTPASSTLDVSGVWDQRGVFSNAGLVRISESGILGNSGSFLSSNGVISGRSGLVGGVILNTGFFSSNIDPATDTFGQEAGRLKVINRGSFTVAAGQNVLVNDFVNESGNVTVNGTVENVGGTFQLLGGTLSGNGFINGPTIVGGGPGVAQFKPGSSPGTMTINGPFSLLRGGVLELEVERDVLTGAIRHDQVIAESFFLNGKVSFLVGAGVTEADVLGLQFLDCGGCAVIYDSNDNHFSFDFPGRPGSTLFAGENGLQITSLAPVPEPGTYAMLLAGLALVIGLTSRRHRPAAT